MEFMFMSFNQSVMEDVTGPNSESKLDHLDPREVYY